MDKSSKALPVAPLTPRGLEYDPDKVSAGTKLRRALFAPSLNSPLFDDLAMLAMAAVQVIQPLVNRLERLDANRKHEAREKSWAATVKEARVTIEGHKKERYHGERNLRQSQEPAIQPNERGVSGVDYPGAVGNALKQTAIRAQAISEPQINLSFALDDFAILAGRNAAVELLGLPADRTFSVLPDTASLAARAQLQMLAEFGLSATRGLGNGMAGKDAEGNLRLDTLAVTHLAAARRVIATELGLPVRPVSANVKLDDATREALSEADAAASLITPATVRQEVTAEATVLNIPTQRQPSFAPSGSLAG